jgi:adenine-specific DNA-methyltransferase
VSIPISYMGTKRQISAYVAKVVEHAKAGLFLDAFSGMCAVGEAISPARQIWNSDAQFFAYSVSHALFVSQSMVPTNTTTLAQLKEHCERNATNLKKRFKRRIEEEEKVYAEKNLSKLHSYLEASTHIANSRALAAEAASLKNKPSQFPYRLATITFADGYFGFSQAIDIDSIRFAIDYAFDKKQIDSEQKTWLVIGLCSACLKCATTTGHFAQYLTPNETNLAYFLRKRQRDIWTAWVESLEELIPIGSKQWRRQNRAFYGDSAHFLRSLATDLRRKRPSVIYADPPYTDDQYSRYYHVWETLLLYDYPNSIGKGRYREARFNTDFSRKTGVVAAFDDFIASSHRLKADLIISYPENGLLHKVGGDLRKLLKKHYSRVDISRPIPHQHSTMGASKGTVSQSVNELIYLARST